MNAYLTKAQMLLQTRRYQDAEAEIRRMLAQEPNSAVAHSLMAVALIAQGRRDNALREAQHAVHLAPDLAYSHYVLALTCFHSGRLAEAEKSVREAIRLDPRDADHYAVLGEICLEQRRWRDALNAAETGLRIEPEDVRCINVRATALVHLGRWQEAESAVETALALEPENAMTHANRGWLRLHRRDSQAALADFREALRLRPNMVWAQEGIVEALKARNPIYSVMLRYFLWMSRMDTRTKWSILIGGYIALQLVGRTLNADETLRPLALPLIAVYVTFVFLTWTSQTLFDLLLRLDPFGKLTLSKDKIVASNWVGLTLLAGVSLFAAGLLLGGDKREPLLIGGLQACALILPISGIFHAHTVKGRQILTGYTVLLIALIVWRLILTAGGGTPDSQPLVLFVLGLMLYTWIANVVISMK